MCIRDSNTHYHADPEHPALLFSGDFKGDGSTQLIEAYYEGDRLYPWRSRRDMGAAIPSILKRYSRNDYYGRATVAEIFGEARLAKAQRFAATELRSGVFLSQLLRGDGRGHFAPVAPAESGLIVPGDAKALAVLDLGQDGWPGFLVTRNNSSTLAFRNGGVAGHKSLRVVLRAPAGNPTAVGARITVELSDGSTETSEVYAGSGYYSQSTAACFFGYPASTPPRKVHVRWPSGAAGDYDFPPDATTLTLTAPAGRP